MKDSGHDTRSPETPTESDGDPVDAIPEDRPGVPREAPTDLGAKQPTDEPSSQEGREERLSRATLDRATPVFGTAQPLHGTSGRLRRWAYSVPEHRAHHWMLLMAADRVDLLEDRVGGAVGQLFGALGLSRVERRLRDDPLPLLFGAAAGALLARRFLKDE